MRKLKRGENRDTEDPEDDPRASMRRLIEDNADGNDEGYHDEEEEPRVLEAPSGSDDGPRVVPSPLTEHNNEWRNEGQRA